MSGILSYFTDWMTQTMKVQKKTAVYERGVLIDHIWQDVVGLEAVKVGFYHGRQFSTVISDRIKDEVDATIIIDPESFGGVAVDDTMRGIINGKAYYFLDPDDIAKQGEVVVILTSEEDKSI